MNNQIIFLTGFMGTGKTTIGKILAKKLNFSFIDLDQEIENLLGVKISEIFSEQGEAFFRKKEREILFLISRKSSLVIALGGGTFCFPENIQICRERGLSIYLKTSANNLRKRYSPEEIAKRPLLSKQTNFENLLNEREQFYQLADLAFVTDNKDPEELSQKIIKKITESF